MTQKRPVGPAFSCKYRFLITGKWKDGGRNRKVTAVVSIRRL